MEEKDVELFNKILLDTAKRYFEVRNKEHNNLMFKIFKLFYSRQQMPFCNQQDAFVVDPRLELKIKDLSLVSEGTS